MSLLDPLHIRSTPNPRTFRNNDGTIDDTKRLSRKPLAVLPDLMSIDRCLRAGSGTRDLRKHRQGKVKVIV